MTEYEMAELFEKYEDEFLKFERIGNKLSKRADLHAFLMLDDLCDEEQDIISHASHDEITLSACPIAVADKAEEWQIVDLIRCGVRYSTDNECFEMFV